MNSLLLRNITHVVRFRISLAAGIMLSLLVFLLSAVAQSYLGNTLARTDSYEMLAYVSNENALLLYDPYERSETTLLENVRTFLISSDGRIAFTKLDDSALYVFDPSTPALEPININPDVTANHYSVAWSLDGHYLAFASYHEEVGEHSLYVWDGEQVTNVMPDDGLAAAIRLYVNWAHDGRLAFMIVHGWSNLDVPSEIYLWDGQKTVSVSQNPEGADNGAVWSRTGQLMFGSTRGDINNIYIWDGVSYSNGLPDLFLVLLSERQAHSLQWSGEDNVVTFTVNPRTSPTDRNEIIWWNLETETILRRHTVVSDNAGSRLSDDEQLILSTHLASGLPSFYLDIENTEGEILFTGETGEFSLNSDGYLAYCRMDRDREWVLSLWDGRDSWDVARISYKPVQWLDMREMFSCNSG